MDYSIIFNELCLASPRQGLWNRESGHGHRKPNIFIKSSLVSFIFLFVCSLMLLIKKLPPLTSFPGRYVGDSFTNMADLERELRRVFAIKEASCQQGTDGNKDEKDQRS